MGKTLRGAMGPDQWDLGGQWIGTCQLEIMSLLSELKLTLYCQYSDGKRLLQVSITFYKKSAFNIFIYVPLCIKSIEKI